MRNFSFAGNLNKVWMLALVAFMVACSQFEAQGPDDVNLESSEDVAALKALSSDMWNARLADCDGPTVEPITDLTGPGGNVECSQAGEYEFSSGRVNFDEDDGTFDNDGNWPEGFTIHTDGTNVSWEFTPFMKDGVLQCLKDLSVIVKGGAAANVYTYSGGETEDCGLVSPNNASGGPAGLSNLTLCYNLEPCEVEECWYGETAWSAGSRYVTRGNWATFTSRADLKDGNVILYAGQTLLAGFVNSAGSGDGIEITITLNEGWRFADTDEPVKVQDYATAPSGNPAPGGFDWKDAVIVGNTATITVPINEFYGIHVDVEQKRECPVVELD